MDLHKKQYQRLAEFWKARLEARWDLPAITREEQKHYDEYLAITRETIKNFACMLKNENANFNEEKFLTACGV